MFTVSETWKTTYPGAAVGILAMHDVVNPEHHAGLDGRGQVLSVYLEDPVHPGQGQHYAAVDRDGPAAKTGA